MGGYKRKKPSGVPKSNKKRKVAKPTVKRMINAALNKNIETKMSVMTQADGIEILHNNFVTLTNSVLKTTQGITDPNLGNTNNRIGDKINLRGISFKMMIELNERFSDVTFRILVVKCARGDTPTRITLFNNLSGNKMIDTINRERYTILAQKWVKIRSAGLNAEGGPGLPGEGNNTWGVDGAVSSRATRIVKMWVPGKKFARSGVVQYENGSENAKFFDYHVLCYAYSNYSTLQDMFNVGRVNDFISQMYFKDA